MSEFSLYGFSSLFAAIACGVVAFQVAKRRLALAWYLNLVGAILASFSVFTVFGWFFTVTNVIALVNDPAFGGIPLDNAINSVLIAVSWYSLCWSIPKWLGIDKNPS